MREGVSEAGLCVTGNTVIDAALAVHGKAPPRSPRPDGRREILVTLHRRESQGETMTRTARAIAQLALRPDVHIFLPLHPSPAVRDSLLPALRGHANITLSEPISYQEMIAQLGRTELVLTDSGGLQEEAPAFDIPVMVLRDTTERPEGVTAGCSVLCGTDPDAILETAHHLLDDATAYGRMASARNPYGDGHAAERIADFLLEKLAAGTAAGAPAATTRPAG